MADAHVEEAVNAAIADKPGCTASLENLIGAVGQKFIEQQLARFPWYCYEARRENKIAMKALQADGNPGGWSGNGDFKLDYIIPRDLYLFMVNMVYKGFWDESNERQWRKFMRGIIRGDDAMDWLKALKLYYGTTQELKAAGQL